MQNRKPYSRVPETTDDEDIAHIFAQLDEEYVRAPINRGWWMGYGYVCLKINRHRLIISDIWVEARFRGNGAAGNMLRKVLSLTDASNIPVRAYPLSFDKVGKHLSIPQLREWYGRFGFKPVQGSDMLERQPHTPYKRKGRGKSNRST